MSPEQMAARLRTLRDRTGEAVCLDSAMWFHERAVACEPIEYSVWIAAHRAHYTGTTAEDALTAAEDACLYATAGDGA